MWSLPQSTNPRECGTQAHIKFADFWKEQRREACNEETPRLPPIDKTTGMTLHRYMYLNVIYTPEAYWGRC
jgi:hypothetical protein